jgi:iron(III) transport system permease protein
MSLRVALTRAPLGPFVVRRPPPPPLVLVAIVVGTLAILPTAYLVVRALGADAEAVALLVRPRTLELLASSTILAAGVGLGAVGLGVPLAWLTTRTDLPGRRAWSVLAIAPLVVPSYVLAFAFVAALGPTGALADLLRPFGVERLPSVYGLPAALFVLTMATYPYVVLAARAAMLRSDPELEEAARSLGDRPATAFRRVALPLLTPAVGAGALLAALYAISDFGAVSILRFDSFARAIHVQYRSSFDRSSAAALALLLIAATLLLVWAEARVRGRIAAVPHDRRRPAPIVRLGRWRWLALGFCAAVCGVSLVLPAGTVTYWLVRSERDARPLESLIEPARDSLVAGTSAAALAVALAVPAALLLVRYPGRIATVFERVMYGAYAVPGICMALAIVFFTLNAVPALYQTFAVLILAYAIRFLPQSTAATRGALMTVRTTLGDAARSLGEGQMGVLRTITIPLLRPGLLAGAALVFLSTIKELPLTLLVAPTGFRTLATQVWDAASEGFFARAAAPAALLMLISIVSVAFLTRDEGRT